MKKIIAQLFIIVAFALITFDSNAQAQLSKITKSGVIKIGMTGNQPPFSMEAKDGSLMGYEVDLAELLAESMSLKLEIVRLPFNELLPSLEKGKIDAVMSGMAITMERNMKAAFVGPYVLSGKSILTKTESLAKAEEAEDLNQANLKITSLKGSTSEEFVKIFLPEASSLPADNLDLALEKLLNDEANVMVADYPTCVLNVMLNPASGLVTLSEPLTVEPIGMALPANDPLLINFMENYLKALIMSGLLSELETYWFENGSWLAKMK
jgi:ABC-type amino acid transport substrate-binding protein